MAVKKFDKKITLRRGDVEKEKERDKGEAKAGHVKADTSQWMKD